jgi:hypothetical protein
MAARKLAAESRRVSGLTLDKPDPCLQVQRLPGPPREWNWDSGEFSRFSDAAKQGGGMRK